MRTARYRLTEHPAFNELLSREDLLVLSQRGSIGRGDLCEDEESGQYHTVGELIGGMRRSRGVQESVPRYQEIRGLAGLIPVEEENENEEDDDASEEDRDETDGQGEEVVFQAHPSWLNYGKSLAVMFLMAIGGAVVTAFFGPAFALAGYGAAAVMLIGIMVVRFSKVYVITDERVEVIWGVIGRSSKEVRIRDIRSIDVRENWVGGLLGLGSVDFSSSANAGIEVAFESIRRAHRVKELVRRLQRELDAE